MVRITSPRVLASTLTETLVALIILIGVFSITLSISLSAIQTLPKISQLRAEFIVDSLINFGKINIRSENKTYKIDDIIIDQLIVPSRFDSLYEIHISASIQNKLLVRRIFLHSYHDNEN